MTNSGGPKTLLSLSTGAGRRMRKMALICLAAASLAGIQGCSATSGTVGASGGPTGVPGSSNLTTQKGWTTTPATASDSTTGPAPDTATTAPAASSSSAPSPSGSSPSSAGKWQPAGQLADAEQIDESVGADHKLTATWPKGQPADHALTIKLLAKRNGDELIVNFYAANYSGQKVSLLTGMFGGATAVDESGQSLDFDEFNKDWTLTSGSGSSPYLEPGQPMAGNMVIAAPKTGNTFNMYWTQAVDIRGVILIRDIPIVG